MAPRGKGFGGGGAAGAVAPKAAAPAPAGGFKPFRPAATPAPAPAPTPAARPAKGKEDDENVVGTCEDMCPQKEIEIRLRLGDIDSLERYGGFVKRFARTIEQDPQLFRTRSAMAKTANHLLHLMDHHPETASLKDVHRFLWDRYRGLRTDLTVQHVQDEFSVTLYEQMVRFHIFAEHELCEEAATVTDTEGFDSHLNIEQLQKCFASLFHLYDALVAKGRPQPNEGEFMCYFLLLTMGTHGKYGFDASQQMLQLSKLRPEILGSAPIQFFLHVSRAFKSGNYVRFFKYAREAPYHSACLLHAYFVPFRTRALQNIVKTLSPQGRTALGLDVVCEWFMIDTVEEAAWFLQLHGLEVGGGEADAAVTLDAKAFSHPAEAVPRSKSAAISGKRAGSFAQACITNTSRWPAQALVPPSAATGAAERQLQQFMRQYQLGRPAMAGDGAPGQVAAERIRPPGSKSLDHAAAPAAKAPAAPLAPVAAPAKPAATELLSAQQRLEAEKRKLLQKIQEREAKAGTREGAPSPLAAKPAAGAADPAAQPAAAARAAAEAAAEREKAAAAEAEERRQQQLAAAEERRRAEAEARRRAEEAERQRRAAEEERRRREAAEELQRQQRAAAEEAERQRRAASEERRRREAEAERRRREVEERRRQALEAERQRQLALQERVRAFRAGLRIVQRLFLRRALERAFLLGLKWRALVRARAEWRAGVVRALRDRRVRRVLRRWRAAAERLRRERKRRQALARCAVSPALNSPPAAAAAPAGAAGGGGGPTAAVEELLRLGRRKGAAEPRAPPPLPSPLAGGALSPSLNAVAPARAEAAARDLAPDLEGVVAQLTGLMWEAAATPRPAPAEAEAARAEEVIPAAALERVATPEEADLRGVPERDLDGMLERELKAQRAFAEAALAAAVADPLFDLVLRSPAEEASPPQFVGQKRGRRDAAPDTP